MVAVSCALSGASRGGMSMRTRHSGSCLSPLRYVEPRSAAERIPAGAGDPSHQRVVIREGADSQLSRAHGMQIQGDGLIGMYQSSSSVAALLESHIVLIFVQRN
jgi:hypothetical protein